MSARRKPFALKSKPSFGPWPSASPSWPLMMVPVPLKSSSVPDNRSASKYVAAKKSCCTNRKVTGSTARVCEPSLGGLPHVGPGASPPLRRFVHETVELSWVNPTS